MKEYLKKVWFLILNPFLAISIFIDAFAYGFGYENKIQKLNEPTGIFKGPISNFFWDNFQWFWEFIFWEWKPKTGSFKGETLVPFYRILIQWPLDIIGLYLAYRCFGWLYLTFNMILIFFTYKEYGYYKLLGQEAQTKTFVNPFWLIRKYFIFGWIGYKAEDFSMLFEIGALFSGVMLLLNLMLKFFPLF